MATARSPRRDPPTTNSPTGAHHIAEPGFVAAAFSGVAGPPPTYAAFSPTTLSSTASAAKRRSTILVHQKSPLLLATPPQITRALAYSHPFLLPLNKAAGLLSWTTGDPWESFLAVAAFWGVVLYGDFLVRVLGPVLVVLGLMVGMYGRRFSPLSSSGWSEPASKEAAGGDQQQGKKGTVGAPNGSANAGPGSKQDAPGHQRSSSTLDGVSTRHQKTLDEMVETLREFTSRCNILLEPLLELTDFLSTQQTPTSATTRPALTALLVRILLCTPFWIALTLPPWRVVTTRRVVLVTGTIILTWHARVCCVGRTLLWRSRSVRRLTALVTGLEFDDGTTPPEKFGFDGHRSRESSSVGATGLANGKSYSGTSDRESELTKAIRRSRSGQDTGVRFTFIIYENQRRWVGLGWTSSLFTYERAAWTDERNNPVPPRDRFELPEVEDSSRMRWRWVEGSRWRVEGVPDDAVLRDPKSGVDGEWNYDGDGGKMGWVYYDNKWQNGRRGQDSWARWTRRRKWYRDAELVEIDPDAPNPDDTPTQPPPRLPSPPRADSQSSGSKSVAVADSSTSSTTSQQPPQYEADDAVSLLSTSSKSTSGRTKGPGLRRRAAGETARRTRRTSSAAGSSLGEEHEDTSALLGTSLGLEIQGAGMERDQWGVGDDLRMSLE